MSRFILTTLAIILAISNIAVAGPKVLNETPTGTVNGSNTFFQLAMVPFPSSLKLYKNGIRLAPSIDFTVNAQNITFKAVHTPSTGDVLLADYEVLVPQRPMQMANKLSDGCLANQASSGGLITTATCYAGDSQKVLLSQVAGGYMVTFKNSGQQLDVLFGGTDDGAQLCQYPFWGGDNELWLPVPTTDGDGSFYLQVKSTNFGSCLTLDTNSQVVQRTCSGLDGQKWRFK